MSHRTIPSTFVKSVLHNGVGRYVCQLQRITLKFCKSQAGSRGMSYMMCVGQCGHVVNHMPYGLSGKWTLKVSTIVDIKNWMWLQLIIFRDFVEKDLLEFVHKYPGIVVYLQPRRHHGARLVAEYLNGNTVQLDVANKSSKDICEWIEHLRCRSGDEIVRLRKMWHTDTPSVQGIWTPFTNLNPQLAVTALPNSELSQCFQPMTATTYLSGQMKDMKVVDDGAVTNVSDRRP